MAAAKEEDFEKFLAGVKEVKKLNVGLRRGRFEPWEVAFIKANYTKMTDEQIANELYRDTNGVCVKRKALGIIKEARRPTNAERGLNDPEAVFLNKQRSKEDFDKLNKSQKRKLFENRFQHTTRYRQLREIFDESEIDMYTERWLDYMNTWETLLSTEEDTLHLAIIELIRAHRILVRQREAMEGDEENNVPVEMYERQYKETIESYNKLMSSLAGTRQQRLASNKEEKITIVTVVQSLQDKETRARAGREAAIITAAKNMTQETMRTKNYLIDGNG